MRACGGQNIRACSNAIRANQLLRRSRGQCELTHQTVNRLANDLFGAVAEYSFGTPVPAGDRPVESLSHDRVVAGLDDRGQPSASAAVLAAIAKLLSGEASPLPSALPGQGFLLDPKRGALPAHAGASRPASLLLAKHRLVPFDDFHGLR
jgi:hypothetical protein